MNVFKFFLIVIFLVIVLGFVIPFLVSANDDMSVGIGIVILLALLYIPARMIERKFKPKGNITP